MQPKRLTQDHMEDVIFVSRTQKKKECTALQKAGEKLLKLSPSQREAYSIPLVLKEALLTYDSLSGREAKHRHIQYIGRIMREQKQEGTIDILLSELFPQS